MLCPHDHEVEFFLSIENHPQTARYSKGSELPKGGRNIQRSGARAAQASRGDSDLKLLKQKNGH